MDRIGIVFYSRTGTARAAAERLASLSGWPVHEVRDAVPRFGLGGDARCVIDSLLKRSPDFRYDGPALNELDHVVLIAPVWLRSLAAPMRAFLKTQGRLIKAYSAICVMSGYGGFRAIDDIATLAGSKPRSILLLKQYDVLSEECDASLCRFKEQTLAAAGRAGWEDPVLPAID
jgi:flavodoxin